MGLVLDRQDAPLSVHNIAATGHTLGKETGQWHTPSVTARALQYVRLPAGC